MSVPAKLTYIDNVYLTLVSRRSKAARALLSYRKNHKSTDLAQIRELLSIEARTSHSRLLRIFAKLFRGYNTDRAEHKIYLIAEYELYYRDSQSDRI